jgi:creatinine amidohydrolase
MPTIIHYKDLTWPEVAALPRDLPLVLPLGEGYDPERIAAALGAGDLCMLPALPYGWAGSAVDVGEGLLRRVVEGLFSGPQEERFSRLVVVHQGEEDLSLPGVRHLRVEPSFPQPPVQIEAGLERVILIPSGHTEQHGYHLPMDTDTVIIGAIAEGVVRAIPDRAESLPVLPYGVSTHRSAFAGTFNMGGRVYEDLMLAVLDDLVGRGADRFYLISGHGGNVSFLVTVVKYAGERHPNIFAATTWLHTSGRVAAPILEQHRRSARGGMGHAGELETAYMLHLCPARCHMDRVVDETDFITTPGYYMDWIEGGELAANPPWSDDTQTGSYGAGSLATAENGRIWLEAAVAEKIVHVEEIHEQQDRRLARRAGNVDFKKEEPAP